MDRTHQAPGVSAPPLRLRLVRSRGAAAQGAWLVPVTGEGLTGALALDGRKLDDKLRQEADLCRIDPHGLSWRLCNGSGSLACALNGERVPTGATVPVAHGDRLELGLLRFVAELEGAEARIAADAAFDLRDLARPSMRREDAHGADWRAGQPLDDPLNVLDINGARSQPLADPLAELLGASPGAKGPQAASAAEQPLPELDLGGSRSKADPADALLDELHEEFVRAVRDPAKPAKSASWEHRDAFDERSALTTLEDLTRDAVAAYPLVRDVVLARETIDEIIDGFGLLDQSALLQAEEPYAVLTLFAPELAQRVKTTIPSLTLREHHTLSPDSPMPAGWWRHADEPPEHRDHEALTGLFAPGLAQRAQPSAPDHVLRGRPASPQAGMEAG